MTHRSTPPRPRQRRRGELTRINADASKHELSVGPFKGRPVGALEAAVLEDQLDLLAALLKQTQPEPVRKALEADQRAINEERERRWLAFTS
jgi:hypothetical protein